MVSGEKLTPWEWSALAFTLAGGAILSCIAWACAHHQLLLGLAASAGALGGLVHELAQSRGTIMFFQKKADGLYIGSLAGMVLGAVAGILVMRGHLTGNVSAAHVNTGELTYEIFLAGLSLKGITEAAGGEVVEERDVAKVDGRPMKVTPS